MNDFRVSLDLKDLQETRETKERRYHILYQTTGSIISLILPSIHLSYIFTVLFNRVKVVIKGILVYKVLLD